MIARGGKLHSWIVKPVGDPSWTAADWGRAATLDARYAAAGVKEEERRRLVPCAIFKAKFPETTYAELVEKRLGDLKVE